MKRIILISLMLCVVCLTVDARMTLRSVGEQRIDDRSILTPKDSLKLCSKLDEYLNTIKRISIDEQKAECDFLISTCQDSVTRGFVAEYLYEHYLNSPVMGVEAVAIHIFDKWYADGTIGMEGDFDLLNAKIHADFNRLSLLGMNAPILTLETPSGESVTLNFTEGTIPEVLFFYDTDCPKCKLFIAQLNEFLQRVDYDVCLNMIYVGDDEELWQQSISRMFYFERPQVEIRHFIDVDMSSEFQKKYGVLSTPRMFLVESGVIVARGLDVQALQQILNSRQHGIAMQLVYGDEEIMELYGSVLRGKSSHEIVGIADGVAKETLHKGDTLFFKQVIGDMIYSLSESFEEGGKEANYQIINKYIFGEPDVWTTHDDSLKVVGLAEFMNSLLSKNAPGTLIADIEVEGEYVTKCKRAERSMNLRDLKGKKNIIIFYTPKCSECVMQKEIVGKMLEKQPFLRLFLVNVGEYVAEEDSELANYVDLSLLPHIIETDRRGKVLRRYVIYE